MPLPVQRLGRAQAWRSWSELATIVGIKGVPYGLSWRFPALDPWPSFSHLAPHREVLLSTLQLFCTRLKVITNREVLAQKFHCSPDGLMHPFLPPVRLVPAPHGCERAHFSLTQFWIRRQCDKALHRPLACARTSYNSSCIRLMYSLP